MNLVDSNNEPVVKNEEENPTREENQEGNQGLSVKPRKTDVKPSGDDKHEDHEEFSVEPREHADMGVRNVFETIQVEMKKGWRKRCQRWQQMSIWGGRNQET